ncbi:urea amidolyase associated protein UAAP1 [Puniceicoccus vermicola]|uniref:Urea carboxylase-associated family protein n=1 Tax=Puniceicoccus vermicola TaxID=388746 RepID=A0A7X1B0V9_9BACT|nr:urea amidolyase associated protein UAAP1 [Puniceicoccus vermicola]MBC2602430.1 urea carboxylase-associated family protein [Puniceicoccus vermicola]
MSQSKKNLFSRELGGGQMWSKVIGRGKCLRMTDLEGGANVGMLLYNALEKTERYNMPDTLKGQKIFYLREPYCLHSDMGRILASIVEDGPGWHDTVCGTSLPSLVEEKYGKKDYQEAHNDWYRAGRELFLIELGKWGLGERDLVPNINWFSKIAPDEEGKLSYVPGHSTAGSSVTIRFELDSLVVLNTCQHPLDPNPRYEPKPVKLEVFEADPVTSYDPSRLVRPENERAFQNTEDYNLLRF